MCISLRAIPQSMNVTREPASTTLSVVGAARRADWALVERVLNTAPQTTIFYYPIIGTSIHAVNLVKPNLP
jgi:hypothetical protein